MCCPPHQAHQLTRPRPSRPGGGSHGSSGTPRMHPVCASPPPASQPPMPRSHTNGHGSNGPSPPLHASPCALAKHPRAPSSRRGCLCEVVLAAIGRLHHICRVHRPRLGRRHRRRPVGPGRRESERRGTAPGKAVRRGGGGSNGAGAVEEGQREGRHLGCGRAQRDGCGGMGKRSSRLARLECTGKRGSVKLLAYDRAPWLPPSRDAASDTKSRALADSPVELRQSLPLPTPFAAPWAPRCGGRWSWHA